ncbi:hypothetical protein SDJN02_05796, partial [Cucurbita argyrosperma subsp. argyrosperma]
MEGKQDRKDESRRETEDVQKKRGGFVTFSFFFSRTFFVSSMTMAVLFVSEMVLSLIRSFMYGLCWRSEFASVAPLYIHLICDKMFSLSMHLRLTIYFSWILICYLCL